MPATDFITYLSGLEKCVLSQPAGEAEYSKISVHPVLIKNKTVYQLERFKDNKVYHLNLDFDGFVKVFSEDYYGKYRQILIVSQGVSHQFTLKQNGNYKHSSKAAISRPGSAQVASHNRQKNYILAEGECIPAFVDLGIFTSDFKLISSRYDKYRQINRFIELIDNEFSAVDKSSISILDFGCGKSYLTFVIYYYFKVKKGMDVKIIGYDLKADVVSHCNEIAAKYGYENLHFVVADVTRDVLSNEHIDMVVSLHACDTATDYALFYAIQKNVKHIFSVPCCQHEINSSVQRGGDFDILLKHGIVKERLSALLTDSIRADLLEDMGYSVDMIEFVDFDNSPKNIMLRARKLRSPKIKNLPACEALAERYGFSQALMWLIKSNYSK